MNHLRYGLLAPGLLKNRYAKSVVDARPSSIEDQFDDELDHSLDDQKGGKSSDLY